MDLSKLRCGTFLKNEDAYEIVDMDEEFLELKDEAGVIQNSNEPADFFGETPVYQTIYRDSVYQPWTYAGECPRDERRNMNPDHSNRVYICSRFAAESSDEQKKNVTAAQEFCRSIFSAGDIPIAPHIYFPQFIDDSDPEERDIAFSWNREIMDECDLMIVLLSDPARSIEENLSAGMRQEIEYWTSNGRPVSFIEKVNHKYVQRK